MRPWSQRFALFAGAALAAALLALPGVLSTGGLHFGLDDPYIHLAFAEQLVQGHIGASPGIASVPVSSPVWPVLLLPGAALGLGSLGVWAVMLGCLFACALAAHAAAERLDAPTLPVAAGLLIVGNAIPLTLLGMEHLLQVALALAAAGSVLALDREHRLEWWGLAAVGLLPLVRFEGIGLAGLVALVAAMRGDRRGVGALGAGLAALGAFLAWTHAVTGHWLPGSVLSKLSTLPPAWQSPEQPWVLGLWVALVVGLLPIGGRRDLGALASAVCAGHLIFGRASNHDRYVPYALAVAAVWLAASLTTPRPDREPPSAVVKGALAFLLAFVHVPAWVAQPKLALRTHTIHGAIAAIRDAADAPIATHDIGMACQGATHPVVDLLGLGNVPILDGWLDGDPRPAMAAEMARHDVHLIIGLEAFFGDPPADWRRVAVLEPLAGQREDVVRRLFVYAVDERWTAEARAVVEAANLDDKRRIVLE